MLLQFAGTSSIISHFTVAIADVCVCKNTSLISEDDVGWSCDVLIVAKNRFSAGICTLCGGLQTTANVIGAGRHIVRSRDFADECVCPVDGNESCGHT